MPTDTRPPHRAIRRIDLRGERLPPGRPPLRFVQLSDLHMRAYRDRHEWLAESISRLEPDFVFLTGDMIVDVTTSCEALGRLVRALRARHRVLACRGNWEFKQGMRAHALRSMLGEWGAELLINATRTFETAAGRVFVGGIDDLARGWPDFDAAVQGAHAADYAVLLCHEPVGADLLPPDTGIDLMLSGHTHGGQVKIPVLWRLALPSFHGGYCEGLYQMPWGRLYVSRGFGGSGRPPVRFRCPPEAPLFRVAGPSGRVSPQD